MSSVAVVKPGDNLPNIPVKEDNPLGSTSIHDLQGKIIIVGVPGAFTPACSSQVPGYLENFEKFQAKGIAGIYVITVNDAFVVKAWKAKLAGDNATDVHFISDDRAAFVSALGLVIDVTPVLGGHRSHRFALIADSGKVEKVFVEEDPGQVTVTAADNVLNTL
ncbi:hypothetical protein BS47DRAFT_1336000 [Hydnum rufescens UP504]|uniref:Thioredoxin domain-containing protein n=1 Tax=Hydnum rufescens UP504 TaxID=1448309 RepID=A0A9P6B9R5_9AGAM|nr:hypothetical protein BS47DRAFT_1336000 [Hydnum rufescens UP504]